MVVMSTGDGMGRRRKIRPAAVACAIAVTLLFVVVDHWVLQKRYESRQVSGLLRTVGVLPDEQFKRSIRIILFDNDCGGVAALRTARDRVELALFFERLRASGARPGAVVLDYFIEQETNLDGRLQSALDACVADGCPVLAAARRWSGHERNDGPPPTRPALLARAQSNASMGIMKARIPWTVFAYYRPIGGEAELGLALAAAKAVVPELVAAGGLPSVVSLEREMSAHPDFGIEAGDMIGALVVDLPSAEAVEAATSSMDWLIAADDRDFRASIDGKFVVIGDGRPGVDGPYPNPEGGVFGGYVALSAGIAMLANGNAVRLNSGTVLGVPVGAFRVANELALCAAASGVLLSFRARSRWALAGICVLVLVGLMAACALHFRLYGGLVSPLPAFLSAALLLAARLLAGDRWFAASAAASEAGAGSLDWAPAHKQRARRIADVG